MTTTPDHPPGVHAGSVEVLRADWRVPPGMHAITTLRGTVPASAAADDGFDVSHRGPPANRQRLAKTLGLPGEPFWLDQVHGTAVARPADAACETCADAAVTNRPSQVLAVLTADCLPVALCHPASGWLAVAHAGWRGLAAGVLEQTLAAMPVAHTEVLVWLGPAIGPRAFEVGAEVRDAFLEVDATADRDFVANRPGHWLADLYGLARRRLAALGVNRISGGHLCTHGDARRFFSYRRDGASARMATLVWRDPDPGARA